MDIKGRVKSLQQNIIQIAKNFNREKDKVNLMAVTKTVDAERVNQSIDAGIKYIGENKVHEILSKYDKYNKQNIKIHFIGHLQSNKVKMIIDKVDCIESLDRLSLAQEIQKQCVLKNINMDCLIEINIGEESSKSGIRAEDLFEFVKVLSDFDRITVRGLMSIPPQSQDNKMNEFYFSKMQDLFEDLKKLNSPNLKIDTLSMGMSEDYESAIKCGSTIVRLGRAIFGERI